MVVNFQKDPIYCGICGIPVKRPPSHIARVKAVYCSRKCQVESQKTKLLEKKCKYCYKSFLVKPSAVKRYSTCSKECQRKSRQDEKNANWKGGKTTKKERKKLMSRKEYKEWRLSVFIRDNYTCQTCMKRGGDLEAHHIKPWAQFEDLRYDVNNGQTLCETCHHNTFRKHPK
jgi:5-methylcytosine-specific restriction endonuclease McrA